MVDVFKGLHGSEDELHQSREKETKKTKAKKKKERETERGAIVPSFRVYGKECMLVKKSVRIGPQPRMGK